jgi:hypothetical protein
MSKLLIPLVLATIRRDANTITTVAVPPYELAVLRQMFGKEHVTPGGFDGEITVDAAEEYKRLCSKYGREKIVRVYGDDDGERLLEVVERANIEAASPKRPKEPGEPKEPREPKEEPDGKKRHIMSLRAGATEAYRSGPAAAV